MIQHSMVKNNRIIIECCNDTHQGVPYTGKQTCTCASDLGDASHVTRLCRNQLLLHCDVCFDLN